MRPLLTKLDWYIIRKFLGTFALSIVLVMSVAVVFDITEKMDNFFESQLRWWEIVQQYYVHFVPYYLNMFSSLFIFISVIFFTSKLAGNSEIIAMTAAGMSYQRLMRPYFLCALLLSLMTIWMNGYIIPPASGKMLAFTDKYVQHFTSENARNVQMEVEPGTVLYIESFQQRTKMGYRVSMDRFDGKELEERITADRIRYDSAYCWHLEQYIRRSFDGMYETLDRGPRLDMTIPMLPEELFITAEQAQEMTNPELREYIEKQRARGAGNIQAFETELHKRWAAALGAFIMTLLGVTMSSTKVRGGMGKNLGIGIALTTAYILFSTVSTTFSVNGVMSPFMAAWLPNIIFLAIGIYLYIRVRK